MLRGTLIYGSISVLLGPKKTEQECMKKMLIDVLTPNQFSTLKIVFLFGLVKLISGFHNLKSAYPKGYQRF